MLEKTINGFSVVAYATQPEGRVPARAFLETRRLAPKVKPVDMEQAAEDGAELVVEDKPEGLPFEIFVSRRFRNTIEAMSAARNALDRVKSVDEDGVPDHLPE